MKNYNAIDLTKLIASILVVCIHTNPLMDVSPLANSMLVDVLARISVPFFFMSAGFFLSGKLEKRNAADLVLSYGKRIFILYLIWSVIYLPLNLYQWYGQEFAPEYWAGYIQAFFFEGSYYTLWFFPALIFAAFLALLTYDRIPHNALFTFCILLYVTGALGQCYYDLIRMPEWALRYYQVFLTTRNGLFFGFPFLCLGIWARRTKRKIPASRLLLYFTVSLFFLGAEVLWAKTMGMPFTKKSGMWICVLPAAFFFFLYISRLKLRDGYGYLLFRKLSTLIYVSHGLFVIVFSFIAPRVGGVNSLIEFLFVFGMSFVLSLGILKLSQMRGFGFLQALYE